MTSMDRHTGRFISGKEAAIQAAVDLISTELGSRPFFRDYGLRRKDLIDRPLSEALLLRIKARTVEAIETEIKTLKVEAIDIVPHKGRLSVKVNAVYRPTLEPLNFEGSL